MSERLAAQPGRKPGDVHATPRSGELAERTELKIGSHFKQTKHNDRMHLSPIRLRPVGAFNDTIKTTLRTLLPLLFLAFAHAGGPSIDSNNLKVGKIIATPDTIIMEIDGSFNLFTPKTPEEEALGGSAKSVGLVIPNGILRIPKKQWKHPGGDEFEVYLDWDKYTKEIKKWEGKEISAQMWSAEVVIRNGVAREIIAEVCKIWDKVK